VLGLSRWHSQCRSPSSLSPSGFPGLFATRLLHPEIEDDAQAKNKDDKLLNGDRLHGIPFISYAILSVTTSGCRW
jgi:hypothetical protein